MTGGSSSRSKLVAVIGDIDTCTGFILAGVGDVNHKRKKNFLVVEKNTTIQEIELFFNSLISRHDIGIILINQPIAEMIRYLIDKHTAALPTVLEIPSKESPYDPYKDSVYLRLKNIVGNE